MSGVYSLTEVVGKLSGKGYKIIQDPVNGPIKIPNSFQGIIDSPEFQRLRYIRSLGLCYLVFPGANHTRFEHSIGTMHLADLFSEALDIEEKDLVMASALLHDVGHPPLSHSNEDVFKEITGMEHLDAGLALIEGKGIFSDSSVPESLESMDINPSDVVSVLKGDQQKFRILSRMVSGPVDVDELDYLRRDALYCGVQMGNVDHRRIINVAVKHDNDIVIEEKGIVTLESILIARILMYSNVYFHKTSRIAQIMTGFVIKRHRELFTNPFAMDDPDLFQILKTLRDDRIARALLKRELYKPLLKVPYNAGTKEDIRESLEKMPGLEATDYIIDVIPPLEFTGPARVKSDLKVLKNSSTTKLTEASPLIGALRETLEHRSIIVSAAPWALDKVRNLISSFNVV